MALVTQITLDEYKSSAWSINSYMLYGVAMFYVVPDDQNQHEYTTDVNTIKDWLKQHSAPGVCETQTHSTRLYVSIRDPGIASIFKLTYC